MNDFKENDKIVEQKIINILNEIRPYLNLDGGDISFIKYEKGTVFVKLYGECSHCLYQDNTINDGILLMIQETVPEVKEIINIEL